MPTSSVPLHAGAVLTHGRYVYMVIDGVAYWRPLIMGIEGQALHGSIPAERATRRMVAHLGTWSDGGGVYAAWFDADRMELTFTTASRNGADPYSVDTFTLTRTPEHDDWAQWSEYAMSDRLAGTPDVDPSYPYMVRIDGQAYGCR